MYAAAGGHSASCPEDKSTAHAISSEGLSAERVKIKSGEMH